MKTLLSMAAGLSLAAGARVPPDAAECARLAALHRSRALAFEARASTWHSRATEASAVGKLGLAALTASDVLLARPGPGADPVLAAAAARAMDEERLRQLERREAELVGEAAAADRDGSTPVRGHSVFPPAKGVAAAHVHATPSGTAVPTVTGDGGAWI
jgi:hypothetical protein